jgi:hypothetical protein
MTGLPPYAARFSYGRLFADCGRVLAGAWLPIVVAVVVLGIVPSVIVALPWWKGDAGTARFQGAWVAVTTAKNVTSLVANSMRVTFLAGAALKVLTDLSWPEVLRPRRLVAGLTTSLSINLLVNWAALAGPLALTLAPYNTLFRILLAVANPVSFLISVPFIGIAVSVAIAEERWVGSALVRSFRLLRGLRWRMFALALGYLLSLSVSEYVVGIVLAAAGIAYVAPGPGLAAVSTAPLLLGVVAYLIFVSFFLQARRIADGPSAGELHDVFA